MTNLQEDPSEWLSNLCLRLDENDPGVTDVELKAPAGHTWSVTDTMALLDSLRKSDQVTRLSLRNLELSQQGALILGSTIMTSPSLRTLELEDCPDNEGHVADVLAVSLFYNRTIQTLNVGGSWDDPTQAFSLGFLSHTATLSELRICHNRIDAALAKVIASGLKTNTSLRILDLTANGMDDEAVAEIAAGLVHNTAVEFVSFDFNAFGDQGVAAVSQMLAVNSRVTELHLFGSHVSAIGAEHLADALRNNETLQSLILSFNQIGDRGAVALAQALTINTTLTKIWFPSNAIGFEGMQAFADHLPRMKGLEQLNVGLLLHNEAKEALVEGLKGNSRLSVLEMEQPICEEFEDVTGGGDMDFYLRLNRSGRRLIRDPQVQPALWAEILSRTEKHARQDGTPDVLHYLLREKPELLGL
jgi:Ran GTPase-activating protein (RanGAP) involved in mRNA processing and transport